MLTRSVAQVVKPAPRDSRREVLAASPDATVFSTPEWIDACCAWGGYENVSQLYLAPSGRRIVFPAVRRRAAPGRLATTWSLPHGWHAGGALADGPLDPADVAAVVSAGLPPATRVIVKPGFLGAPAWRDVVASERRPHLHHVVDLRGGYDAYWSRTLSSNTRNQVRRARKSLEVRWGHGEQYIDDYNDLLLRWTLRRAAERGLSVRLGLALARHREPIDRYRTIAQYLGGQFRVAVAVADDRPVAAAIALTFGRHAQYYRATSDREASQGRYANHLLVDELARDAATRGCDDLDLGESGGVATLAAFKRTLGGQPRRYDELVFQPSAVTAADRARRRLMGRAEQVALAVARRLRG